MIRRTGEGLKKEVASELDSESGRDLAGEKEERLQRSACKKKG